MSRLEQKRRSGPRRGRRLYGFDAVVLAGGAINAAVIAFIVGYWLLGAAQ